MLVLELLEYGLIVIHCVELLLLALPFDFVFVAVFDVVEQGQVVEIPHQGSHSIIASIQDQEGSLRSPIGIVLDIELAIDVKHLLQLVLQLDGHFLSHIGDQRLRVEYFHNVELTHASDNRSQ